MEFITNEVEMCEFFVGYFDPFWILVRIEFTADSQAGTGRGGCNKIHNDCMADQRLPSPVLRDVS